jgi:hypothetical protein
MWVYPTLNVTNAGWPAQRSAVLTIMKNGGESDQFKPLGGSELGKSWMVTLFNGEGYQLRGGIRLGRTNKFRASEIGYEIRSSDPANILQLRGRFTGLSVSRIGVDWDTGLTLSAGDPLVNEIAIAGVANGFVSSGPKDDEIIRKFILHSSCFMILSIFR